MKAKKLISSILFVCMLLPCIFVLSSCGNDLPDNSDGVEVTLIVLDLDKTNLYEKKLVTTKSSLYEALNEFDGLEVKATSSYLGAYVNSVSVGTIEENEYGKYFSENTRIEGSLLSGSFIAIYHNIDMDTLKDLSPYANELDYFGNSYYYSGVSISLLPLYNGATYILKLASF